jgi:hypothetical protein
MTKTKDIAPEDTILVFTGRSVAQMVREGGSEAWRLDLPRARACTYMVATQNRRSAVHRSGSAPHGDGFIVAKIDDIVDSKEEPGRYCINFTKIAPIDNPKLWPGLRNPVRYTTLDNIGIDVTRLVFRSAADFVETPSSDAASTASKLQAAASEVVPLTMIAAKRGLAAYFGVDVDAIEVTIHG